MVVLLTGSLDARAIIYATMKRRAQTASRATVSDSHVRNRRPDLESFLGAVLDELGDLPEGLAPELLSTVRSGVKNRVSRIRDLIEKYSAGQD